MLRSADELYGSSLGATDGEIGRVKDLYFDDSFWTVRYLVVDTGKWLGGRTVLISPGALKRSSSEDPRIDVELTKRQIEDAPDIDAVPTVSREQERKFVDYYGWPHYWQGGAVWASGVYPPADPVRAAHETTRQAEDAAPNLRSAEEVAGYTIHATDEEIGHVEDFIVDDGTWQIRYMVVDTGIWWTGHKILVSPEWILEVTWNDRKVAVDLSGEEIRNGPEWDGDAAIEPAYERKLLGHYGRER